MPSLLLASSFFLLYIIFLAHTCIYNAAANPIPTPQHLRNQANCTNPVVRKEWGAATDAEKLSYINAALCLATKPSRLGLATTLYDDFSFVHNNLTLKIHGVAAFLPWHRYFTHIYEAALQECGYTGAAMYWDWANSSSAPASSPIWSPTLGLGGDGDNTTHCITTGPFTSLRPAYLGDNLNPHCIRRAFFPAIPDAEPLPLPELLGWQYAPGVVDGVMRNEHYDGFHIDLETGPHSAVHTALSGEVGDMGPFTSPNDPVFFLHHVQVDRLWYLWQQTDPGKRMLAYEGGNGVPGGGAATLDDVLPMAGLAEDRVVRDLMSTVSGGLCYTYI